MILHSVGPVKKMTDRLTDKQAITNAIPVRFYRLQASVYTEALSYTVARETSTGVLIHVICGCNDLCLKWEGRTLSPSPIIYFRLFMKDHISYLRHLCNT